MEKQYQYNSVEEALEELRRGRIVLVTDDPDRENEGDMICAGGICNSGEYQFYGMPCERADLHTDECSAGRTAWAFTDGLRKYR